MVMFAVLAAALALVGAPATTQAACLPVVTGAGDDAWTWYSDPPRIELGPKVCAGAIYLGATPSQRVLLRTLNPTIDFTYDEGVAALLVLHEATHAGGNHDETSTECQAFSLVADLLARYVSGVEYDDALSAAHLYDGTMPHIYHEREC